MKESVVFLLEVDIDQFVLTEHHGLVEVVLHHLEETGVLERNNMVFIIFSFQ